MSDAMEALANNIEFRLKLVRAVLGKAITESTKREIGDASEAVERVLRVLADAASAPAADAPAATAPGGEACR